MISAVGVLVPRLLGLAALGLVCLMAGATMIISLLVPDSSAGLGQATFAKPRMRLVYDL